MSEDEKGAASKSQKSPDAFRTISEVSTELDVPQHVLRFWETKFPVVKPLKRGGGRRYYRPSDVELVKGIRDLLYTHGFTIKGAQKLLKEQGNKIENIEVLQKGDAAPSIASEASEDETVVAMPTPTSAAQQATSEGRGELSPAIREELENLLEDLRGMRKMLPK
ncbi:MAG: MerR family transcriptional regulator [Sneathiella sp.]|nr:MerR family transcriptional regulator [Sneathiella sp.]